MVLPRLVSAQLAFITNNGAITITGYSGFSSAVFIPDMTNGWPIKSIGIGAFQNKMSVTSVTIPNGATNIGAFAFAGCYGLTNVTISANVSTIGSWAFNNCRSLKAITVNPTNAFYSSTNGVLFNKAKTTLIQCPGGLVGSYTVPDGITNVGSEAFLGSTHLGGVTIPASVTSIASSVGQVFQYCLLLTNITVASNNPAYSSLDGVLFDKNQTTLLSYPCGLVGNYTVPDGVSKIAFYAFAYCFGLTGLTIPASVTNLDGNAFFSCGTLSAIHFLGNGPATGGFAGVNATVYYLPGTTGWDDFLAATGLPGMLWLPQIQTGDGRFGVQTNQFGFNVNWASGQTVVVEAAANLANPAWQPLQTNLLTTGTTNFNDPQWSNFPVRFYRLRSQ